MFFFFKNTYFVNVKKQTYKKNILDENFEYFFFSFLADYLLPGSERRLIRSDPGSGSVLQRKRIHIKDPKYYSKMSKTLCTGTREFVELLCNPKHH